MTITLTSDQEKAIKRAIDAGLVRSVDEFIETAIGALPLPESGFDPERASAAVARIRELRKGVRLDLQGMSIRELAHIGHKY
ncbi:MAG: hypothetical protein ABSB86_05590 [Bryobacteraceae bacterium]|jgi:Arc/MetJ-type ribon-helix-helix transcriptional regulator